MSKLKLNIASLFSGCGGMDLGFEGGFKALSKSFPEIKNTENKQFIELDRLNTKTVFACDIDEYAKKAWTNYFNIHRGSDSPYLNESIVDIVKKIKNKDMEIPSNIHIVTGGFPCNDFSVAGDRNGLNSLKCHTGSKLDLPSEENRGMLYYWMREFIGLVQPNIFIAENVAGMTSLEDDFQTICDDFSNINESQFYLEPVKVLNVADFGVPQNRRRVIFIGINKSKLNKKSLDFLNKNNKLPISLYPEETHLNSFVTSYDAIYDLPEPENSNDPSHAHYSKAKYLNNKSQGQVEIDYKKPSPTIRAEHHGNIEFRRLNEENNGKNTFELQKGLQQRRLSVRECARLQSFPDDFQFVIPPRVLSASRGYKMIGNAVPPVFAYKLAQHLLKNWDTLFV